MFDAPFTHSVWRSGERRTLSLSFGGSLLFHAGLAALVVYVLAAAPTGIGPPTETFLIALGTPGPGGGEVPLADPGARGAAAGAEDAATASDEAVEESISEEDPEEPPLEEPDLSALDESLAEAVPPDSLVVARADDGEGEAGQPGGEGAADGGEGGRGGGAGGGATGGLGPGSGGQGGALRPLHLVVPRVPPGVSAREARGRSIILLVEVLPDGAVGEVRVERSTGNAALDGAAVDAARQMRYMPTAGLGTGGARWTRTEMRF